MAEKKSEKRWRQEEKNNEKTTRKEGNEELEVQVALGEGNIRR